MKNAVWGLYSSRADGAGTQDRGAALYAKQNLSQAEAVSCVKLLGISLRSLTA